jgi:hypothetical protein
VRRAAGWGWIDPRDWREDSVTDDRDDEAAVLATLDRFGDACSRMDVAAALNVFAADDDILLVGSEVGEMVLAIVNLDETRSRKVTRAEQAIIGL